MGVLDLIILLPLLWGAYMGYRKGLLIELISLVVVIVAVMLSFKLLTKGIAIVGSYVTSIPKALPIISFLVLFIVLLLGLSLLGKALKGLLHKTIFKDFDKVLGAALGLFKFAFIVSNLLWVIEKSESLFGKKMVTASILFPFVKPVAQHVYTGISWAFPFAKDLLLNLAVFLK
jgi:membrane protein required for colicin V production